MKSRLTHLALLVLGAAGVVLPLLIHAVPKYATLFGALALLVADAKKALGGPIDIAKPAASLFALLLAGHALFGCATTHAVATVAKSCEPSTDQEAAILDAAAKPTQAEALAAIDALGFLLCVLQRGADEAIASLTPKAGTTGLALSAGSYSPVLDNLRAWRQRHP